MVILLGPAGSGKSVQGELLVKNSGYDWVSLGHLLRDKVTDPELKAKMAAGELLADEYVEEILGKMITEHENSQKLILDGFPRNAKQVKWLLNFADEHNLKITRVVHLLLDAKTAKERLSSRGRTDDSEQVIDTRRAQYDATTATVIDGLKAAGVAISEIDASGSVDEVHQAVASSLAGE